ncbi:MAG: UDP-N-acetylglucosamine 2-epimerase (non-hydrolyzing) [bacterium]|nr:UDP-N-acetylglucosamine 2-epimerase (non-hydrolyzing) [bacterium]
MKKIISIVGTRPQFIKVAPLHKILQTKYNHLILHTGQHYDENMSEIFFKQFSLKNPDYCLHVGSGNHGEQSGKMLIEIEKILIKEKPNLVIVYGDTNSTLSGILASSKLHIPTAHIEAGMRSFNRGMPEEINRIVADHLSNINFCVTKSSFNNLVNEGITKNIHHVGDTMYDTFLQFNLLIKNKKNLLDKYNLVPYKYIITTIHRASNTEIKSNLTSIINALIKSNEKIIFPIHPRTKKYLIKYSLINKILKSKNIQIINPIGYLELLTLTKYAKKVVTDSGGVQKEAYFLKVPCITLRDETEWIETTENNWNILVGSDEKKILNGLKNKKKPKKYNLIYGKGDTSNKIMGYLNKFLK